MLAAKGYTAISAVFHCRYSFKTDFLQFQRGVCTRMVPLCDVFRDKKSKNVRGILKGKGKLSYSFCAYFCSRRLRVPLSKFSVALPLQFSICSGELHCFSPNISESQRVCFMGLFVCFNPKENTIVEFFPSERCGKQLTHTDGYSQQEPFNSLLSNFNIPL